MLVQIEVPVSNKYSVRIEEAKSDNLAIYLTNRLLRSLILCLWVGYRSRSTVSYFLCLHASYLPFTHPPPPPIIVILVGQLDYYSSISICLYL